MLGWNQQTQRNSSRKSRNLSGKDQLLVDHDSDMLGVEISRIMEREVIVSYNGRDLRIDIKDVNPDDLRDLFGIDFDVKTLLEVETEKTILVKKKERLKLGFTYVLQRPVQDRQTTSTPQVVKVFQMDLT